MVRAQHQNSSYKGQSKRQITEEKENILRFTCSLELSSKKLQFLEMQLGFRWNHSIFFIRIRHRIGRTALDLFWLIALLLSIIAKLPLSNWQVIFTIRQLHLCLPENSLLNSCFAFFTFCLEMHLNVVGGHEEFLQQDNWSWGTCT